MLIGILQTGHAPEALRPAHGDYPDLFARLLAGRDLTFRTWAVVDGEFPGGPARRPRAGSSPARATAPTRTTPGSRRSSG